MSNETNHELLSAYLDGELSADERERVERLLSESSELRQVYEELCALKASLSLLPRQKLGEDFSSRVVRIVEESKPGEKGETLSAGDLATAGDASAAERASRRWRAIIYPLLAVAAAVAVMLTSEKEKDRPDKHPQIARAPVLQDSPAEMSAPSHRAEMSAPSDELDERSAVRDDRSLSKAKANTPLSTVGGDEETTADEAAAETEGLADNFRSEPASAAGPPTATGGMGGGMGGSGPSKSSGAESHRKAALGSAQATLVVTCKLAPGAVQNKAFELLLARNHLVAVSAPEPSAGKPTGPRLPSAVVDNYSQKADQADAAQRPNKKAEKAENLAAKDSQSGRKEAWSKSVVVELDARQLEAVLADLKSHPEQFLAVELPRQQAIDREQGLAADVSAPSATLEVEDRMLPEQESNVELMLAPAAEGSSSVQGDGPKTTDKKRADAFDAKGSAKSGPPARLRVLFRLSAAPGN